MAVNKSKNQQSTPTNNYSSNLNLQDNTGTTFAGDNNTVLTTDYGAIQGAADISSYAIDLGRDSLLTGERIANAGLENAQSAYAGSLDFAANAAQSAFDAYEGSSDRVERFATQSLDANSALAGRAIDSIADAGAGVLDWATGLFGDALSSQSALADQNLAGLQSLAMQTSASSDDRLQKVVIYALMAVAAILIVPRVFK